MIQSAAILRYLRDYGSITPREALDELGCFRLAARIHDLRLEGHLIVAETVKAGGKAFARYRLVTDYEYWDYGDPEPDEREGAGSAANAMTPAPGQTSWLP